MREDESLCQTHISSVDGFRFDKKNDRGIAVHLENETHSRLCFQSIGNIVEIKREIHEYWIPLK